MTWQVIDVRRKGPQGGATNHNLLEATMFTLRTFLRLDALASGAVGALLLVLAGPAKDELGLPIAFSVIAGIAIVGWAAFVGWVSVKASRPLVREVIALNLVYVLASLALAVADWVALTDLGVVLVVAQAAAVLVLTLGQYAGLRAEDRELVSA